MHSKLNAKSLLKKGVPYILIPGILLAGALGWKNNNFDKIKNYYQMKQVFPDNGIVASVQDGDTFSLKNGVKVRLIGINAPDRGKKKYKEAKEELEKEVLKKKVYLEYDSYQDDKYGRVLAWVWVKCERKPKFLPPDYMRKEGKKSKEGLINNPVGCKKGKLVNEELIKDGFAEVVFYKDRGELKYQKRLLSL